MQHSIYPLLRKRLDEIQALVIRAFHVLPCHLTLLTTVHTLGSLVKQLSQDMQCLRKSWNSIYLPIVLRRIVFEMLDFNDMMSYSQVNKSAYNELSRMRESNRKSSSPASLLFVHRPSKNREPNVGILGIYVDAIGLTQHYTMCLTCVPRYFYVRGEVRRVLVSQKNNIKWYYSGKFKQLNGLQLPTDIQCHEAIPAGMSLTEDDCFYLLFTDKRHITEYHLQTAQRSTWKLVDLSVNLGSGLPHEISRPDFFATSTTYLWLGYTVHDNHRIIRQYDRKKRCHIRDWTINHRWSVDTSASNDDLLILCSVDGYLTIYKCGQKEPVYRWHTKTTAGYVLVHVNDMYIVAYWPPCSYLWKLQSF
jgi:hypothetical protein